MHQTQRELSIIVKTIAMTLRKPSYLMIGLTLFAFSSCTENVKEKMQTEEKMITPSELDKPQTEAAELPGHGRLSEAEKAQLDSILGEHIIVKYDSTGAYFGIKDSLLAGGYDIGDVTIEDLSGRIGRDAWHVFWNCSNECNSNNQNNSDGNSDGNSSGNESSNSSGNSNSANSNQAGTANTTANSTGNATINENKNENKGRFYGDRDDLIRYLDQERYTRLESLLKEK